MFKTQRVYPGRYLQIRSTTYLLSDSGGSVRGGSSQLESEQERRLCRELPWREIRWGSRE